MSPYKFLPFLRPMIWGGSKIAAFKGVSTDLTNIGESWEISSVPGHESVVADRGLSNDVDLGLTLSQLIDKYKAQLVGERVYRQFGTEFPLLIKFIHSAQDLSLQVHPDDRLARERHGCAGKTEMWYVIQTDPGAKIYSGLSRAITPDEFVEMAHAEVVDGHSPLQDVVAGYDSHPGDLYFLPAGRMHAIGAGNFLAEIQQTSDITYRVYDYGRRDAEGHTRQLHIDQAKDAIDYHVEADYRASYDASLPVSPLVSCPYFTVQRVIVDQVADIDLHVDSFVVVVCLSGEAMVNGISMHRGETLLVPASENILHVEGNTTFLTASL